MVINAGGFVLDLDQPTLEETRNVNKESMEKPVTVEQDRTVSPSDLGDTYDANANEQYEAFLTDPRRI